ncbi:MAG: hypothetical protein LW832_02855 [Parachlamydia sp.]|nr:hypothetical protein [Parachlamydia sp.]
MFVASLASVGLDASGSHIFGALVLQGKGGAQLKKLFTYSKENFKDIQREFTNKAYLCTGLKGSDVLIRRLTLPLTKEKDIDEALAFQAEPVLPYPIEEALLARQTVKKEGDATEILLLSARKKSLEQHIEEWNAFEINPEKISCMQLALHAFGRAYVPESSDYIILHQGEEEIHGLLVEEELASASFSQINRNDDQKAIYRMAYSLSRQSHRRLEGLLLTGKLAENEDLAKSLAAELKLPVLALGKSEDAFSSEEMRAFAYPIGLAIASLAKGRAVDFRQEEWAYPNPWKRLKVPLAIYYTLICLLAASFYLFGQAFLDYKQNEIRQSYIDLLAGMNKTHLQVEEAYATKNPSARKFSGEEADLFELGKDDFMERLSFLQKELQSTPDTFPLFPNIPRVADVLAWLSAHPAVTKKENDGQARLQIENFSYAVLKRPMQGKKQEKYQVKVELEFSSPTPKWAREFHDALIASNDWVDPKGEVKWSSNRGRYKTSFFLKDKTHYPSQ